MTWRQGTGKNGGFQGSFEQSQIQVLYQQILFPGKMIYSERDTGSDYPSDGPIFCSTGSGVHADVKYGFTGIFLKNKPFNRFLSLQFSGLRLVSFFATSIMSWGGQKAAGSELLTANAITSENRGEGGNLEDTVGTGEIHTNVSGGTSGQPCHQNAYV